MSEDDSTTEQLTADLGFLAETAKGFLRRDAVSNIYEYIVERLACITGDSWVAFATFHPEREAVCLRALTGPNDLRSRVLRMLGERPIGCYRQISEDAKEHLLTGRLHQVPGGLHEVLFARVPRAVTKAVEQLAGLRDVYAMGCVSQGGLLGSVLILLRGSQGKPRMQVVETLVNQAAVALERNQAEERLRQQEVESRVLIDQIPDLFLVLDRDLTIQDVNRKGCEALGHGRRDLLGANLVGVLATEEIAQRYFRRDRVRAGQPFRVRCQLRHADGHRQLHQARVTPLPDGRLVVIACAVSDTDAPVPRG